LSASIRSHSKLSAASDRCAVLKCINSDSLWCILGPMLFNEVSYHRHKIKCQHHKNDCRACCHIIMCYAQIKRPAKRRATCTDHTTSGIPPALKHERRGLADPTRAMDQHRTGARVACLSQHHHQPHATRRIAQSRGAPLSQGQGQAPDSLPARRSCGRLSRGG
jgi:hypothetical protein